MAIRALATAAILIAWGWVTFFIQVTTPLVQGQAAGLQFDNSDTSYIASQYGMGMMNWIGGPISLLVLGLLGWVWYGPVSKLLKD